MAVAVYSFTELEETLEGGSQVGLPERPTLRCANENARRDASHRDLQDVPSLYVDSCAASKGLSSDCTFLGLRI